MSCSVGIALKRKCSSEAVYRTKKQYQNRKWLLLGLRSGVSKIRTICDKHSNEFGKFYYLNQKTCCNPINSHSKQRRRNLKIITPGFHDKYHNLFPNVVEGRKLCIQCLNQLKVVAEIGDKVPTENNSSINSPDEELAESGTGAFDS